VAVQHADVGRGIQIAYEDLGAAGDPALLLVMGLGTQMLGWRDGLCAELAERGLRPIRFDNRDAGLSTHLDGRAPHLSAVMAGDTSRAPYALEDMAEDTTGLLDRLGIERAHVAGASMGGMVAQVMAYEHPERVLSLTSIMSTTGEPAASRPTEAAMEALLMPPVASADEAAERAVAVRAIVGSPAYPPDEDDVRAVARTAYERAYDPPGFARQLAAIYRSGDRTERVRTLRVPALVIHGLADQLIPPAGGRATAAAIDGAELVEIDGMGHDLPRQLWPRLADAIAGHVERAAAAQPA